MNKRERENFKKLLIKEKEKLLGELKHIIEDTQKSQKEASGDISSYTYHMADVATDSYDREFSLDIASNERKILREIDEALRRIDDGSYGICLSCGKKIAKSRLKVIPHTNFCINCQQSQESKKT
jgi:RNA polymerase-binding protein DksA